MEGIVSPPAQQQQQQARRKEWRAVSAADGSGSRERMFQASGGASTSPRMNLAVRPRDSSRRNGRLYQENPSEAAKDGERTAEVETSVGENGHADSHDEALQLRITEVSRQREQLQQMELELRARFFARSEILRLQTSFDEQAKQHNEIVASLQEQLQQSEDQMQQVRQHLKEREQKLQMEANEALNQVWTKDALLREQSSEISVLRGKLENAIAEHEAGSSQLKAERADLLAQVDELKEQVHEKERRLQEMEEQDMFFSHDKQLRDAQMWMARAQEMEAYHVNTINTMNAEIRDRNEQINQVWLSCQRHVAELERYYNQVIQKLQQDLADSNHFVRNVKELEGTGVRVPKLVEPGMIQLKPGMMPLNDAVGTIPVLLAPDGLPKVEHATGLPVLPAPMVPVMPPSNNLPSLHHYGPIHQPAAGSGLQSGLHSLPPAIVAQQSPAKQGVSYSPTQVVQRPQRLQQQVEKHLPNSSEQSPQMSHQDHSSFNEADRRAAEQAGGFSGHYLDQATRPLEQPSSEVLQNHPGFNLVIERNKAHQPVSKMGQENEFQQQDEMNGRQDFPARESKHPGQPEKPMSDSGPRAETERGSEALTRSSSSDEAHSPVQNAYQQQYTCEANGKSIDPQLHDKDTLLSYLIRVIPAEPAGKIRISSTLPNRLAKMLAPLHWHDYKKHYGRLDEFVESHRQLFVVEGDFVHLREGAQAIISASTAAARATAAASMASGTIQTPTVALTPVAQAQAQRPRSSSIEQQQSDNKKMTAAANGQPGNYTPKAAGYKGHSTAKRPAKEQREYGGNGIIDGYMSFNGPGVYLKSVHRAQQELARPQTQEGRMLEAAS